MFYGRIPTGVNRNQRKPLEPQKVAVFGRFQTYQYNNPDLRTWGMDLSERNQYKKDLLMSARENKEKFTDLAEQEVLKLKSVKVSFGLQVKFSIERNGETQHESLFWKRKRNVRFQQE